MTFDPTMLESNIPASPLAAAADADAFASLIKDNFN